MIRRSRILLLIPHLGGGGAEQVTALLARGLCLEKFDLHLGLITQSNAGSVSLPLEVTVHALGAARVRSSVFQLLRLVRQLKPDVILSGMAHLNFLVLLLRPLFPRETRVLVRQNGTVSAMLSAGSQPAYTRLLYRILYRRADRVICQTRAMAKDLTAALSIPDNRVTVLPNPVEIDAIRNAVEVSHTIWPAQHSRGPHLLAIGRLSAEKGFDLLLRALTLVRHKFPDADLVIAGAGPEEKALKELSDSLGLDKEVHFVGHVSHPSDYFACSDLFVLSSRHEGLPNALLEAAAGGLPIVALPASGGVVDLLRDQPGIWLAPEISTEALASSLLRAMHALRPGQHFAHAFIEEFNFDRAIHAYENLIDTVLKERNP